jgi:hypothetical protein
MRKRLIAGLALTAALVLPTLALAHGAHIHKVVGTVAAVEGNKVTVKTTDGKDAVVMLNAKTRITQNKLKADAAALKVGTRVLAEGTEAKGVVTATLVQVGTAPLVSAK